MFSKAIFSGDKGNKARLHWTNFEKYVTSQQKYNTLASRDELHESFLSTLCGRAYYWFQTIRPTITNTYDL